MKSFNLPIYDLTGANVGTITLDSSIFGVEINATLLHQAIVRHLANKRATTAHVKDRSDVRGGGKKPWRQKGTGNARAGSTRSPLWRGGGVTFGPSNERNYSLRMPQKMRQAALKVALSAKVADDKLIIVDSLTSLDGKTKTWTQSAPKLTQLTNRYLVVSTSKEDLVDRSLRNLPTTKYVGLDGLTIYDIVRFPSLLITKDALEALQVKLNSSVKELA